MKYYLTVDFIDGLKQEPIENDFHVTPCLTYRYAEEGKKKGHALALEWGYWAVSFAVITLK